jgi:hypothetical protein
MNSPGSTCATASILYRQRIFREVRHKKAKRHKAESVRSTGVEVQCHSPISKIYCRIIPDVIWAEHIARIEKMKKVSIILVNKSQGKNLIGILEKCCVNV